MNSSYELLEKILAEPEKFAARLWDKVSIGSDADCWEWRGSCITSGYGSVKVYAKSGANNIYAHRMAWAITYGMPPEDKMVLHRCDNRRCCNPSHLFLGTAKDNTQDMMRKGRYFTPARLAYDKTRADSHMARESLASSQRRDASRANGFVTATELAAILGISKQAASSHARRKHYRWHDIHGRKRIRLADALYYHLGRTTL
jgi:hypothetical protein